MTKIIKSSDNSMVQKMSMKDLGEEVFDKLVKANEAWGEYSYYVSDEQKAKNIEKLDFVSVIKDGNTWKVTKI